MSIVTLQVGQCGNQIGEKLFETVFNDNFDQLAVSKGNLEKQSYLSLRELNGLNESYVADSMERFFSSSDDISSELKIHSPSQSLFGCHGSYHARSVLIDMESKVINKLLSKKVSKNTVVNWSFREGNSYTQKKGSGNNWSFGYCVNARQSTEKISNMIRKEAERCDRLSSFLVCMSLAGGTGSGVGSYYTELLRDLYPRTSIINTCIWPFSTGEVTLQNYNFLLTLNKVYEHSDAVIVLENDVLHRICKQFTMGGLKTGAKPSGSAASAQKNEITFDDLNDLIAHKLSSVFQPCSKTVYKTVHLENSAHQIVTDLCPNLDYKLLSLNNVPLINKNAIEFSSFQWPGLFKQARHLLSNGGAVEDNLGMPKVANKSIAMSLFARGLSAQPDEHFQLQDSFFGKSYQSEFFCSGKFSYLNDNVTLWQHPHMLNKYEKSLTMLSNSQMPIFKINSLVDKAWKMFSSKAYIHQYLKYDAFEENDFLNAFIFVEQLIKNYTNI